MQFGDYRRAQDYYTQAIKNMKSNLSVEPLKKDQNITQESKALAQYDLSKQMADKKFLLSTRHFMNGMAALEQIRETYSRRSLLKDKTTAVDLLKSGLRGKLGASLASSTGSPGLPLSKSYEVKQMNELIN